MLKKYLTKVVAVATIAAGAVFIAGCGGDDGSDDPAPAEGEGDPENEEEASGGLPTPPGEDKGNKGN